MALIRARARRMMPRASAPACCRICPLTVAALCFLGPFVWIALAAFKTQIVIAHQRRYCSIRSCAISTTCCSPAHRTICTSAVDSLVIAVGSTCSDLAVATLAAFSLNRMRWPALGAGAADRLDGGVPHGAADHARRRVVCDVPAARAGQHLSRHDPRARHHEPADDALAHAVLPGRRPGRNLGGGADRRRTPGQILWHIVVPLVAPGLGAPPRSWHSSSVGTSSLSR